MQASATLPALVLLGEAASEAGSPPAADVQVGRCPSTTPMLHDVTE